MKRLIIKLILLTVLFACIITGKEREEMQNILLPQNLLWEKLQTGLSDIDSLTEVVNTDFFILYGNILIHGTAPIHYYIEQDSLSLEYEAGIISYKHLGCTNLSDTINAIIILEGKTINFKNNNELVYQNRVYLETNKMFKETKKDLKTVILKEIKKWKK